MDTATRAGLIPGKARPCPHGLVRKACPHFTNTGQCARFDRHIGPADIWRQAKMWRKGHTPVLVMYPYAPPTDADVATLEGAYDMTVAVGLRDADGICTVAMSVDADLAWSVVA